MLGRFIVEGAKRLSVVDDVGDCFGRRPSNSCANALIAATVCERFSASRISASISRAVGRVEVGNALITFAGLSTQQSCPRVAGKDLA